MVIQLYVNGITYDEVNPSGTEVYPMSNGCDSTVTIDLLSIPVLPVQKLIQDVLGMDIP